MASADFAKPDAVEAPPVAPPAPSSSSYGQILKSSAIVGGSSVVNIALGIVRTKILALLLGPAGVGLIGLYNSIVDLAKSIASMGVNSSGVRQIAEAVGTGDQQRISRTVITLRRSALVLGILGGLCLLVFSRPIARLTFGDEPAGLAAEHATMVALLSLAVAFGVISAGQAALVQGTRRIGDLARLSVFGAVFGTVFSIPLVYFFRERGVVPFIIVVAALGIITSWWYARRIRIERFSFHRSEIAAEAYALLKLGLVFMVTSLMTLGAGYIVRVLITRRLGVDAAGQYQAAWALAGLYVSVILQAMGADFFPRLTAVANDHAECNRLVNEQTEVVLLLAGPGILGTLTFASLVIRIFYSGRFGPAVEILQWNCLGMFLQVASWPMGFIMIAKAKQTVYLVTQVISNVAYLVLVWFCLAAFGLTGTGIAFFGSYIVCAITVFIAVRRLSGLTWSPATRKIALVYTPLVAGIFVGNLLKLPVLVMLPVGVLVTGFSGVFSLKMLCSVIPLDHLPLAARKLLWFFRLAPPPANG